MKVVVIGSGVGGLVAATRLAILGHQVQIFEARTEAGGLASGFDAAGLSFDGGPYILLDRPGLEWALERVGLDVSSLELIRAENLYEVRGEGGDPVRIFLDLKHTEEELERAWPGAGRGYARFVDEMDSIRTRLAPLLRVSRPNLMELARRGSLHVAPFLIPSLARVLKEARLPPAVTDAIAIWTHIAGQPLSASPSVMAFIPALLHRVGAFLPTGGMRVIAPLLASRAASSGVEIRYRTPVSKVRSENRRVTGVELQDGSIVSCDAVVSNYHGIGTYDEMVDVPERVRTRLRKQPLQSPGMCAYVSAGGEPGGSYLSFRLDAEKRVRLRVSPAAVDPRSRSDARFPIRIITPMQHEHAMSAGEAGQISELQRMVNEPWWRHGLSDVEVVESRTVRGWGEVMNLYKDSMNPAMTRSLMLRGRIAHRSPWVRGLYLAGASTHPGQWVSFCAISGILAAEALHEDAR
jgi:phytoene dehydrogenase-like protein